MRDACAMILPKNRQQPLLEERPDVQHARIERRPREDDVERSVPEPLVALVRAHQIDHLDSGVVRPPGQFDAHAVNRFPQSPADADADRVRIVPRDATRRREEIGRRAIQQSRLFEQLAAGVGERHAVAMPHEQADAQLFFELADVPAQRWLGNMEALGRLGDARFVGDRDEGAQMSEIHGGQILYQIRIPHVQGCIGL